MFYYALKRKYGYENNAKIEKIRRKMKNAKMNKKYKVRFPDSPHRFFQMRELPLLAVFAFSLVCTQFPVGLLTKYLINSNPVFP